MNSRVFKIGALTAGIAICIAIGFMARNGKDAPPAATAPVLTQASPVPKTSTPAPQSSDSKTVFEDILDRLQKRTLTPAQLLAFRQTLLEGDPASVIPAIRAFLATGKDVPTGDGFEIGEGGLLRRSPTLRLLLLDVLGQLSRKAQTADAAEVSKEILAQKKSSDEWAVAMRNVAWTDPQSRPYLSSKFAEMLRHDSWRDDPSSGFLEAFDVAVFSGSAAVMEPLDDALRAPSPDLQRAAAVALDRLAEAAPLEVMQKLNSQPQMFADYPFLRADWFAKADLRDPAQRAAFETYLSRPDVTFEEKDKALKALAAPGQFVSDNLITPPPAPVDDDAREAAVLAAANDWSRKFPNLNQPLSILRERLTP